jgi:hypothetical protein
MMSVSRTIDIAETPHPAFRLRAASCSEWLFTYSMQRPPPIGSLRMSDSRGTFEAGSGPERGDAVMSLMVAVRDAWALGMSMMQTLAQQAGEATDRTGQEAVADPLSTR